MKTEYCTFYIVRHGQSQSNIDDLLSGHEESPLTQKGKAQAKEIASILKGVKFDAVFSSDRSRAMQTVEGMALERKLVLKTTEALREKFYGPYEGRKRLEVKNELKHLFDQYKTLSNKDKHTFRIYQGGETDHEAVERVMLHLRELSLAYPGKTLLIGSHGGIMRYLLIRLGKLTYDSDTHAVRNTAYLKLRCDGVDFFVDEMYGVDIPKS